MADTMGIARDKWLCKPISIYGVAHRWRMLQYLVIGLCFFSSPVLSVNWQFEPGVDLSVMHTDNINLVGDTPTDPEKERETFARIEPSFSLIGEGAGNRTDIRYRGMSYRFSGDSERNSTFHQYNASNRSWTQNEALSVEFTASRAQETTNPSEQTTSRSYMDRANQTDVSVYGVMPMFDYTSDTNLYTNISYRYTEIDYDNYDDSDITIGGVSDGVSKNTKASLNNSRTEGFYWGVRFNKDTIEYENDDVVEFKSASIESGYSFSRNSRLFAVVGEEDNLYSYSPNLEEPKGSFWELKLNLVPSNADTLVISVGERYFGDTKSMSWRHTGLRITLGVEYEEELRTEIQDLLGRSSITSVNSGINNLSRPDSEVFLAKNKRAFIEYNYSKTEIRISGSKGEREYQETLRDEVTSLVDFSWRWMIMPRTSLNLLYRKYRYEFVQTSLDRQLKEFSFSIERNIGNRSQVSIEYGRNQSDGFSGITNLGYNENYTLISFGILF